MKMLRNVSGGGVTPSSDKGLEPNRFSFLQFELLKKLCSGLSAKSSTQWGEEAILSEQKRTLGVQVRGINNLCHTEQSKYAAIRSKTSSDNANPLAPCGRGQGEGLKNSRKAAFTLAEVLITLGIIGVVAAITMPVLLTNVQDRVKQKRVENIKQKLSKVTDKMAVQSGLTGYGDTMAFVQEMSKHMKLAKICDNDHISDCWPTQEVTISKSGKTWDISKTTDAKSLLIRAKERSSWANTVGIVTADGTPMILSYKKDCDFDVDKSGLIYSNGSATSNSLNCLSAVFDWNGGKNPNKLGDDVITLGKARGLGKDCTIEIGGKCFSAAFTPDPLTRAECEAQKSTLGIQNCYFDNDYWAGAVAECGGVDNMPTMAQLGQLATELYKEHPTIDEGQNIYSGITLDPSMSISIGVGLEFYVWSNEVNGYGGAKFRYFGKSGTYWQHYSRTNTYQSMCLGE